MFGTHFLFPGRVVYYLICIAVVGALLGCTPKIPKGMSDEDLQTCDDTVAKMKQDYDVTKPPPASHPELVQPGVTEIAAPLSAGILPYGEPVVIDFNLPSADNGVLYRHYRVLVTSIKGMFTYLDRVGNQYAVVNQNPTDLQLTWTPPGSGKYIVLVYMRNVGTDASLGVIDTGEIGNQLELQIAMAEEFTVYTGPYSVAYACIQIDIPKASEFNSSQPGTVVPLQKITDLIPTITKTFTFTPTLTSTSTPKPFTPTITFTATRKPFIPSFTPTFTLRPPTDVPPTAIRPTDIPPTTPPPAFDCSTLTTQRYCEARNDVCWWEASPTGSGVCKNK